MKWVLQDKYEGEKNNCTRGNVPQKPKIPLSQAGEVGFKAERMILKR